ncbi:MAG TPA: hypothetical protein DCQ31_05725 [Bacteroidales bacterium]|nr:hypothetical protein [Bacteroidales bacterium]
MMLQIYSKLILYVFSGTGNAYKIAQFIKEKATEFGLETKIIKLKTGVIPSTEKSEKKLLIGFLMPTHGFNVPPIMQEFVFKFPKDINADVFILNTRAGLKMHKLFLPGLSGLAQILPAFILLLKGYKVIGMQPMDMPSNWISIHPGVGPVVQKSISERCERITKKFTAKILTGKSAYKALWSLPLDIAIIPVSFLYYFFGRFFLSKTFIYNYNCNSCGLCAKECPVHAIEMHNDKPYWKLTCESCMHCMNFCPSRAIETPHVFVALVWWSIGFINAMLVIPWLKYQTGLAPESGLGYWLYQASYIALGFLVIVSTYYMLHYLMRFRWFSKVISFTSLTHFNFWRRYKAQ